MKQYILHRTFVSQDGSVYPQRNKPYYESELPQLALQSTFATLIDDPIVVVAEAKIVEKNVVESVYNPVSNPNVVSSHFEPKYHQAEVSVEPVREIDLKHLNSPDHIVQESTPVMLGQATVEEIASLPYISRKVADRLVQALVDGTTFSSYADLDAFARLGFGKSFKDTNLVLPQNNV